MIPLGEKVRRSPRAFLMLGLGYIVALSAIEMAGMVPLRSNGGW